MIDATRFLVTSVVRKWPEVEGGVLPKTGHPAKIFSLCQLTCRICRRTLNFREERMKFSSSTVFRIAKVSDHLNSTGEKVDRSRRRGTTLDDMELSARGSCQGNTARNRVAG